MQFSISFLKFSCYNFLMEKKYDSAIDVLRTIAILAVLLIHTTTKTLEVSKYDLHRFPLTFFLNQSARFAVPLFFMISGFVLELSYPYHASYLTYLKKRFSRIFIPYVFWSAIYYFLVYKKHSVNFFAGLLSGNASYQLYFIPTLLIFYIIFPILHKYYFLLSKKWLMVCLGAIQLIVLYYVYYIHSLPFFYPINIAIFNYYVFMVGIIGSHHREMILQFISRWRIFVFFFTLAAMGYISFEGSSRYFHTRDYLAFYSQWRPSIVIYTISLAGGLYYLFHKKIFLIKVVKLFARLSFFVFFVHVLVLEIVWLFYGNVFQFVYRFNLNQIWFDILFFLTVASISFFTAYLAHKVPLLSKISG